MFQVVALLLGVFAQVCIGELGEGECVGELALEGVEVAPYTVEAENHVRLGQIPISNIVCAFQQ